MRRKLSRDLTVETNAAGFRAVMKGTGVCQMLAYEAARARYRAESVSGLRFGSGVDVDRAVSARGWVGASSRNAGLHALQVKALSQALHGV